MFTILVAEDDASLNKMICAKLAKEQFRTVSAFDGEEALAVMDREHIDLVVSDVMMPKIDGYEITKLLRGSRYYLPILMITAKDQLDDKANQPERDGSAHKSPAAARTA